MCGNPNIDINLLREKTIYAGNVRESDRHIQMFWEVIEEFAMADRRAFLQFVWGRYVPSPISTISISITIGTVIDRSRLPATKVGFGKDAFKISDHAAALHCGNQSLLSSYSQDQYFPVAHTCFFALELPRYSQKTVRTHSLQGDGR